MIRRKPRPESTTSLNRDGFRLLGRNFYLGTFARDTIPSVLPWHKNHWSLIANTKDHHHPGEHWVAFIGYGPTGNVYMFDTYARSPAHLGFDKWFRRSRKNPTSKLYYNKHRLQADTTAVCGLHCLHFLWHAKKNRKLNHPCALSHRDRTPLIRDDQVLSWAVKHRINPFD